MIKRILFILIMFMGLLVSIANTTTLAANWWDKFGTPQYGGMLKVLSMSNARYSPDPRVLFGGSGAYLECLFARDWAIDRSKCNFLTEFVPAQYYINGLAESWEHTSPTTYTVHLRKGIKWQDKPPVNGRELTAKDVEYSYDMILGTGHGYTKPNPYKSNAITNILKVTAVDKYTLEFTVKSGAYFAVYDVFDSGFFAIYIVAPEIIEEGYVKDWSQAVGTGPWVLTDWINSVSTTYSRNPNYWGHDERHPENQIPYLDGYKEIIIPDKSTALAALRTARIEVAELMNAWTWEQAAALGKTNPKIQQGRWPVPGYGAEMYIEIEPFNDIRVRKALQMAIDREVIAKSHYSGRVDGDAAGFTYPKFEGWTLPYDQWPSELQAEYSYNSGQAKELLAEAGYPNGFETTIVAAGTQDIELLEIVKGYFMDIGVDMEIKMVTDMPALSATAGSKMHKMAWTASTGMPRPVTSCIVRRMTGERENYTYCNDPEYDALANRALTATTLEEAQRLCTEADLYALKHHWVVNVIPSASPIFWQPWVKGNSGEQLVSGAEFYYARWWIDNEMKTLMGY